MGITSAQIGGLFTRLFQKGDPVAAMAAGKGPVTAEWAKAHGFKQYRTPGVPAARETLKVVSEGTTLYGVYAKRRAAKGRIKEAKKETKKKRAEAELRRKQERLLRRPSRERGIL